MKILAKLKSKLKEINKARVARRRSFFGSPEYLYDKWIDANNHSMGKIRAQLVGDLSQNTPGTKFNLIVFAKNTTHLYFANFLRSMINQSYKDWSLYICCTKLDKGAYLELLNLINIKDERIHFIDADTLHVNDMGHYVAFLGQHDALHQDALMWMSFVIKYKKLAQLIYSDHDHLSDSNRRSSPNFKPDWSLDFFRSSNYIGNLAVFKKDAIQEDVFLSVMRGDIKPSDLVFYVMGGIDPENMVHIPHVLYHARCCPEFISITAAENTKIALQYHLDKNQPGAIAHRFGLDPYGKPWFRIVYPVPEHQPKVSIIIPTRNAKYLVEQCIQSVLDKTAYKNYEIILVDNGSDEPDSLKYFEELRKHPIIRVMRDDGEFNYSRLNNNAAKLAEGEYLVLMNNDIEVINTDWLNEMLSLGSRPGTGAVGAKLLYPDGRVQHAGVIAGLGGVAGHIHRYIEADQAGYQGRAVLTHNLLVVTAACLLVRRSIYEEVQGLNEIDLKVAFNDVDFCLRLHQAGYINVWTPFAKMYHHESATRGMDDNPEKKARFLRERDFMVNTYSKLLQNDPFYNNNCTLNGESFHRSMKMRFSIDEFKNKLIH